MKSGQISNLYNTKTILNCGIVFVLNDSCTLLQTYKTVTAQWRKDLDAWQK